MYQIVMKEISIGKNEANQRLDKLLAKVLNEAPKSFLYKMMRKKNITVNRKKVKGNEILANGDTVQIFLSDETFAKFSHHTKSFDARPKAGAVKLDVLYEDADILLLNKPAGMLSQKAKKEDHSANEAVLAYLYEKGEITDESLKSFTPGICNRLDRNTSGILAAGKSLAGLQMLSALFRDRSLDKRYYAIVKGIVKDSQMLDGYLEKNEKTNQVSIHKDGNTGARILTQYRPLLITREWTLLEIHLITGKTHQIRAHLASISHPIIGDPKYGDRRLNQIYQEKFAVRRQLLHCRYVRFPEMQGRFASLSNKTVYAPIPKDMQRLINIGQKETGDTRWEHGIAEA